MKNDTEKEGVFIMEMERNSATLLTRIREIKQLVHNVADVSSFNFTANGLLALEDFPVMAYAHEEVADMQANSQSPFFEYGYLDT